MNSNNISRKDFFVQTSKLAGTFLLGGSALFLAACSSEKKADSTAEEKMAMKWTLLDEKNTVAASLGYSHDINTANKQKFPQWKAENKCNKCMHFVEVKNDDGSVNKDYGRCKLLAMTMAPNGPVIKSGGWCSVFAAKPA